MIRRAWPTMGSIASLALPDGAAVADEAHAVVQAWFTRVDLELSPYRADSHLCRWREGEMDLAESETLREVTHDAGALQLLTDGSFHPYDRAGRFDPTGYTKGWAIERGTSMLEQIGVTDACLGIGGDLQMIGRPDRLRPWRVAIAAPHERGRIGALVVAPDSGARFAVATSGNAERGDHIWTAGLSAPRTTAGLTRLASVTVVGEQLGIADGFATAIWAHALDHPLEDAWSFLIGTGYEALALDRTGRLHSTAGMADHMVRSAA